MNTDDIKNTVNDVVNKAGDFINSEKVQNVVAQGKAAIEKGKEFLNSEQGKEYLDKGKDVLNAAKDKLEDFVEDKTDGKGIFGFGEKK